MRSPSITASFNAEQIEVMDILGVRYPTSRRNRRPELPSRDGDVRSSYEREIAAFGVPSIRGIAYRYTARLSLSDNEHG